MLSYHLVITKVLKLVCLVLGALVNTGALGVGATNYKYLDSIPLHLFHDLQNPELLL